jgi:hypothetical protein
MKAHRRPTKATLDNFVEPNESAPANEKNLLGIDLDVLLVRMFAPALRRHVADGALEDFQEGLLHPLTGNVACNANILRLASDLIDLINVNDAHLGALDVVVGILQKPQNDVFDILTDIARFGDCGRIGDAKRHVQNPRECSRQERLARTRWADQQDVALLYFDLGKRTELVDGPIEGRAILRIRL